MPSLLNKRYQVKGALGSGAQGHIHAATDTLSNRPVAIKRLDRTDPLEAERLQVEFRRLSSLDHPHLLRVFDLDSAQGDVDCDPAIAADTLFFTAELIDGVPLDEWLATARSSGAILARLEELASALAYAHHRGVVHCDVKPSNIIVSADRGAVLLDFGLSVERAAATGPARGTLAFMEQRALAGEPDAQSDLHALGVSFFRSLSGAAPFAHSTPTNLVAALSTPPSLTEHRSDLDGPVADLIDALIDSRQRPRSAAALLERVWTAREALGLDSKRVTLRHHGGRGVRLVGREPLLEELCAAVRLVPDRAPAVIALRAGPGVGTRALFEETARRRQIDAIGAGGSLEILRGPSGRVVDQLCAHQAGALAALKGQARRVAAADAAIAGLAERASARPILWIVDHSFPVDERASEILAALAAGHPGLRHVPATVMTRIAPSAELEQSARVFEVPPLDNEAVRELSVAILGENPGQAWLDALATSCLRRPRLLIDCLLEAANHVGPLADLDPRTLVTAEAATSIDGYLDARAAALSDVAADVAAAVAIAPTPTHIPWVEQATGLSLGELLPALDELERQGWLVATHGIEIASAAHGKAAERRIRPKRRRDLHRTALEHETQEGTLSAADRARHLGVIGPAKAAQAARLEAAAYHFERGELGQASELIADVLAKAEGAELSSASLLAGQIAFERGDYDRAIGACERAARSRDRARQRAATLLSARAKQRAGDLVGAERDLEGLLERAPDDAAAAGALAKILLLRGRYGDAAERAGSLEELVEAADAEGLELCLEAAGLAALYQGDKKRSTVVFERLRKLAIVRDDSLLAGRASALLGLAAHHGGDVVAAADHYRLAAEAARANGQTHAAASAEINRGTAEADRGRFVSALGALDAAMVLLRRLGNTAELPAALYNRAHCLFALGDMAAARHTAERALLEARESGRVQFELYAHLLLGDIERRAGLHREAQDCYQRARDVADRATASLDVTSLELNTAELCAEMGDPIAFEHLERAESAGSGDRERLLLSRARVTLALGSEAPGLIDELELATERARERGREDLYWRLCALAARLGAAAGARDRARQNATAALAELRRTLSAVPPERHIPMRRDPDIVALDALDAELELSGLRAPLETRRSSNEPDAALRRLLGLSSRLNSELRLEPLLDQVIDAAIDLAGAERGFLLLRNAGSLDVAVARNIDQRSLLDTNTAAVSRSIAERAAQSGEIVLALDAAFDERFGAAESVAAMRLRSVLAVPLRFRRDLIGTIYVDHRFRAGAFGDRAVQLVRELANIAGVAIGNARIAEESRERAAEINALNAQLESELGERESELAAVKSKLPAAESVNATREIVGSSAPIRELYAMLERMSKASLPVVITGESGSGKELVARALHRLGPRRDGPFVAVNCGAVAETLLESELFGHVRGAFTGADRNRRGHFEVADGGTLFLDEIADTSPAMQAKLLRVLQEGELRRLGDEVVRRVDVRVVAATNRELRELVSTGQFREDLFFRLNVLAIRVPPLRDRAGDIAELAEHLLARLALDDTPLLSRPAIAALTRYAWPGNVRELENELARAAALADGRIELDHLSPHIASIVSPDGADDHDLDLKRRVEKLERELIERALELCNGNQTRAAKTLGLSRYGLQKKLKRYR